MRGDRIQLIRHIAAVQRRAVDLLVVVHQELACLNTARREAHDGDILRLNAIRIGIFADEAHGARHIQRAFLLRVGRQAVIHDERLEAQLAQRRRRRQGIRIIAAELIRAACHQHDRALGLHALANGNCRHIRAEIPVVKIARHVRRKTGFRGRAALLPEIERLNPRRISRRIQDGRVSIRLRHLRQHPCAGIIADRPQTVVVRRRKIVRRGHGIFGRPFAQIVDGFG